MGEKFIAFIRKPTFCVEKSDFSVNAFLKLLLLFYFILIPCSVFIIILKIFEFLPADRTEDLDDSLISLGHIIFLAPVLEESVFRLPLKLSTITLSASFSVFIIFIIKLFFLQEDNYIIYLLSIPLSVIFCGLISYGKDIYFRIRAFWKKHFRYVFYFFTLIFGLFHLFNYNEIYWWMILSSPFLTLPHIIMGFFLGFIRMNYGFFYSLLFHATINFIPSVPLIVKLLMRL
jgi:hypothetical protein